MDELIKLIKNISIYTLGNILNRALGFILIPIYSVYLSTEDYGIISAMTVFISFCHCADHSYLRTFGQS